MKLKTLLYNTYYIMEQRKWDKFYIAVDIHGTILEPTDDMTEFATEYYPNAKLVLQYLSKRDDCEMFLYTCSPIEKSNKYREFFAKDSIKFVNVNSNENVKNTKYSVFDSKPYFNILLDDKALFNPYKHWEEFIEFYDEANIEYFKTFPINPFIPKSPQKSVAN